MQTLYLLDRFGASDEFYHELTQVSHFIDFFYILQLFKYILVCSAAML